MLSWHLIACFHQRQKSHFPLWFSSVQQINEVCYASYLTSDLIGGLESAVVSDVLSQGVSSIQRLLVDAVISVLLHHALGLLLKGLHRRVLPPGTQVSILVVFPPFNTKCEI